jgi:hypothetical protein
MIGLLRFLLAVLTSPFKSRLRLEAENAALRHQLMVLRRRLHGRVRLTNHDRWFLIQLYRWFPSILQVLAIIQPETLVRWHRAGFRCYWRWKSRPLGGRPQIETELRALIRQMSIENSALPHPRSGSDLRPRRHTPIAGHGHPGQAYRTRVTLAEWLCRTADRVDPPRVLGSYRGFWRGPATPNPAILRSLLQRHQNAPVIGQRCVSRPVQPTGSIKSSPILGGLHHHYARV